MFSLLASYPVRTAPQLEGNRVFLRPPALADHREWAALRGASRGFLEPWEPLWAPDELEYGAWRERMRRYREDYARGSGYSFLIFDRESGRMAGGISIVNIRRGVAQSGQIGYWMGQEFAGRGLMSEALGLLVDHAFDRLRLHRIEAACIPDNQRSIRVLEKAGFRREGLLRSYLKINGLWQDHYLYALIAGDRQSPKERNAIP
jgi:ribosomal-protein-alanine N-acetyltransferase